MSTNDTKPVRCVEFRIPERFQIARKILKTNVESIGSKAVRNRILRYECGGHGEDLVQALLPHFEAESIEPGPICRFIDRLEIAEKAIAEREAAGKPADRTAINSLYEDFQVAEAVLVQPEGGRPLSNDERRRFIGFHRAAGHIKLSVADGTGPDESRQLRTAALDHLLAGLELASEWEGDRPKLWRVTRLKLATNAAVAKQLLLDDGTEASNEEFRTWLKSFSATCHLTHDSIWYGTEIVPKIPHYIINAFECCSITNNHGLWREAIQALGRTGDITFARARYIAAISGADVRDLKTFANHFRWLEEYNHMKTTGRRAS